MAGVSIGQNSDSPRIKDVTMSERIRSLGDTSIISLLGWSLICGCTFMNLANFTVGKDEVGLDGQVLVKLGLVGLAGVYGLFGLTTRQRVQKLIGSFPILWMVVITFFYFLAVPNSITPLKSFVSASSILCVLLLTVTALDHLGVMKVLTAIVTGMALFIVGSWLVYFFVPSIGILVEPLPEGQFAYRMSGLAHANTLGQYSGLTLVLIVVIVSTYQFRSRWLIFLGLLALGALVNCLSRTSVLATVVALAVGYRHVIFKPAYFKYFFIAGFVGLLVVLLASTQSDIEQQLMNKLAFLSKSGDTEELTTATGRSEIWAYSMRLISEQPLTGYGATTSVFFLEQYSQYTHNLILNVAFSSGIFGGLACVLMILGRLRSLFFNRHPLADSVIVFIVVNGIFENVIFSILAGMPTMIWIVALCWPLMADDPAVTHGSRGIKTESDGPTGQFLRLESSQ